MASSLEFDTAEPATATVRLTQKTKAGGCASKLAPGMLSKVLRELPTQENRDVLVGFDTSDDAGVFRLSPDQALVQTVDFFTPMVDDPFTYGRIAATNALSDVYAMGGRALTALAMVCFPQDEDPKILEEIMKGGLSVMTQAGCAVVGGHSVRDQEIKFGYAVTGLIHPDRIFTNGGAQVGDALIFTKALGTGVITTALKKGTARQEWVESAVLSMTTSNRSAAEVLRSQEFLPNAVTDVTGFGLLGHAREVALASGVCLRFQVGDIGLLPGALECVRSGAVPAGLLANRDFVECMVEQNPENRNAERDLLLYDPQTSGGLLIALPNGRAAALVAALRAAGYESTRQIGSVEAGPPKIVLT